MRLEDAELAVERDAGVAEAWRLHPARFVIDNSTDWPRKLERLVEVVMSHLIPGAATSAYSFPVTSTAVSRVILVVIKQHLLVLDGEGSTVEELKESSWVMLANGESREYCRGLLSYGKAFSVYGQTRSWKSPLMAIEEKKRKLAELSFQDVRINIIICILHNLVGRSSC